MPLDIEGKLYASSLIIFLIITVGTITIFGACRYFKNKDLTNRNKNKQSLSNKLLFQHILFDTHIILKHNDIVFLRIIFT
jgi:hypothetical protein